MRGENGGEQFEVSIKDLITPSGQEPKVAQVALDTWQQVSIPLEKFEGQNTSSLENLSLSFTYESGGGTIYVDQFDFSSP